MQSRKLFPYSLVERCAVRAMLRGSSTAIDGIANFQKCVIGEKLLDEDDISAIESAVAAEIEAAVEAAHAAVWPEIDSIQKCLYRVLRSYDAEESFSKCDHRVPSLRDGAGRICCIAW